VLAKFPVTGASTIDGVTRAITGWGNAAAGTTVGAGVSANAGAGAGAGAGASPTGFETTAGVTATTFAGVDAGAGAFAGVPNRQIANTASAVMPTSAPAASRTARADLRWFRVLPPRKVFVRGVCDAKAI